MNRDRFENLMQDALRSYAAGCPVIILDTEESVLHGGNTLTRIREQKLAIAVLTIYGVPRDLFESSNYQDALTAARLLWWEQTKHRQARANTA